MVLRFKQQGNGFGRRGRPFKRKFVEVDPSVTYFKPRGVPLSELDEVVLTHEELEAIRLSDNEELSQIDAAEKMGVHQSTFQRTLARARKKIADAIVNGKSIKIDGGWFKMPGRDGTGPIGNGPRGAGRARGQGGFGRGLSQGAGQGRGQGYGGPGVCKCPKCGKEVAHVRGQPCTSQKCPDCGTAMLRGD